jgi:antitoxin component YwqK of YwqJK toxin-antitoxin module
LRRETHYRRGMKHGTERVYFRNGEIQIEVEYYNNMFHGRYKKYTKDGKLIFNRRYENNNRIE